MAQIAANTTIYISTVKNRIKELCNNLLPNSGYYDYNSNNWPQHLDRTYLSTRSELVNRVNYIVDNFTPSDPSSSNPNIYAYEVFQLLQDVFFEMSRCRYLYYYDLGSASPGNQSDPSTVLTWGNLPGGTWTYFNSSFTWVGGINYKPGAQANSNTNNTGFKVYPDTSTNWNNNARLKTNTGQSITVNSTIKAVQGMEAQISSFINEWTNKNNNNYFWNGSSTDTSNSSNRVLWVRYWCHSNCHENCHSNCHKNRSRR